MTHLNQIFRDRHLGQSLINGSADLPIGLTIKLIGLDEHSGRLISSVYDDHVSRDTLPTVYHDDVAHSNVHGLALSHGFSRLIHLGVALFVQDLVSLKSLIVIISFLGHSQEEHEDQGRQKGE